MSNVVRASSDRLHHAFFKTGIVILLSAGALWGALLLLRIGHAGSFTAVSIHDVNAHGHAQIFGWVGLFVLGFSAGVLPRILNVPLWKPGLVRGAGALLAAGIALRSLAEPLSSHAAFSRLALAAAAIETIAAVLLTGALVRTISRRATGEPGDAFLIAGLFWFAVQAFCEAGLLYLTLSAPTPEVLLSRIATFQGPVRDVQLHGFALFMLLGITQRYLVPAYELGHASRARSMSCLALLIAAVVGEASGLALFIATRRMLFAEIAGASIVLLAVSVLVLTQAWRLFGTPRVWDPSLKFVKTGYIWLYVSLAMLVFMPAYLSLTGRAFSHAYYGATRHAITVGFVSLLLMGTAARAVSSGGASWNAGTLRLPFALVNVGCGLRVLLQAATDFTPWAYRVIGVSGLLEVSGMALWSAYLWRAMRAEERTSIRDAAGSGPALRREAHAFL